MKILQKAGLAIILSLTIQLTYAQHIFKGKVIDEITRQPIEYAGIRTLISNKTTVTDKYGNFQLSLASDTATLFISYMGYTSRQVKAVSAATRIIILLSSGRIDLNEVAISPNQNNASFHTLSTVDLNLLPVNSSQDLMRLVPGLFIAQHMGGGKAEQIFIRGFDADHGTDLNVSVDGMPVNMVSHIHGQGYADLHFLIPETVATYDFGKGPYYTDKGDFTTAGYLNYTTKDALDKSMISLEGGQFNTFRVAGVINLLSNKARQNGENAYIAGEYNYTDGAFKLPEQYKRTNLFGKYTKQLGADNKLSLSASTFSTSWVASGELPERAVAAGTTAIDNNGNAVKIPAVPVIVDRFGTIDSVQGGKSTRINAIARLTTDLKNNWTMENQLYYTRYTFLLHINSTFFAEDSINGDERQQQESRDMYGYNGQITKRNYWGNCILTSTLGLSTRFDRTYGSEYSHVTEQYQFLDNISKGDIRQNNTGLFLDEALENGKWLLNVGSRLDYFNFNYHDTTKTNVIISPKINIQYTANSQIQFYLKAGKGFHSNNAIAVIGNNGLATLPAAYGADLGLNWKPLPRLYINAALWYLYLQQEFIYTDDGDIAPGGKTKREGIDLSARYQLAKWFFADLNVNLARPRLADSLAGHGYLALAPTFTSTGGLNFKLDNGINGGLSYRYMHSRPGNNTNTLTADGYYVTDLKINYTQKRYEAGLTMENLFNTKWNEFEAEQVTRLRGEAAPVDQMSFTPGTPFFAKLRVAVFF
ncbi:MAG: vitamin B12/cobalamin outer rane transporter [Mucilaginibacter sp.]|nr:vitamin B12/cobalamin outer rane transporter [Mucilaginibacter sp.]